LLERILRRPDVKRTIVFTRTKHGANRLTRDLERAGIASLAIHGNKSQNARDRALSSFKTGEIPVLVATDVAARGIDVDDVSHVVNFDVPNIPESYVHRIGRTGRAGAVGQAISLCAAEERPFLADIEKLIKKTIPSIDVDGNLLERPQARAVAAAPPPGRGGGGRPGGGGGGGGRSGGGGGGSRPSGGGGRRPRYR
jgi:ATP-dependent RNA helicase RhlE